MACELHRLLWDVIDDWGGRQVGRKNGSEEELEEGGLKRRKMLWFWHKAKDRGLGTRGCFELRMEERVLDRPLLKRP